MDHQCGFDLLSDLPLSIIHIILGLIPFRDAVRTSILSREWRYTWATLPRLVLDKKCVNPKGKTSSEIEDCMKNVVTHVLSHHKGPIHKFKMPLHFKSSCPDIAEWILHLSRNDVKELILDVCSLEVFLPPQMPSSIYSCEKLPKLKLENCGLDPPPSTFKGFLFLRCLSLHDVNLPPNTLESLVANSPLLERIELVEFYIPELRIGAPNLKSIDFHGGCDEICIYAPLLSEMLVLLTDDNFTVQPQQQKNSLRPYTNFLGGFTNLEKLCVESEFVKYLTMGIESCHHTLVFHHLKDIEINDVNFEDIKEISLVARLIIGAPNLQKLQISTDLEIREKYDSASPEVCFSHFGCAPDFAFEKLRVVVMKYISGFPSEVKLMEFLLQSSPMLETMKVRHLNTLSMEGKQLMFDKLLDCGRAAPYARLSFSKTPSLVNFCVYQ